MREPQVDTFCRCVKKVKKTLKAREGSTKEQGAIAVCTNSVLQSKGRTLRKVRCRDKVLETQPMKGGVDQMGGEADQIGGKFKWMGADTPVFNNEKMDGWNGFPVMLNPTPEKNQVWLDGLITKYNPVVRMVSGGLDGELPYHKMLREMLENTDPFNQPFVKMHFNLMAEPNSMYPVDYTATLEQVKLQGEPKMTKRLEHVGNRFVANNWFGLVTRTQKSDVYDLATINQRDAMCDLLRVLLRIDGRIIHADLHRGNMAIMYDGTPVIHDVGRMKIRDPKVDKVLGAPIERAFYYALLTRFYKPNYYMGLSQHFYIARMFKKIRKLYGETFPPPTKENEWEREDPVPTPDNYAKFQKWLNDPATGGKDGETNCFQIARVYDILSILKGLSDLSVDRTAQLSAYYYARKTAVTLTSYLLAGFATKENVNKIVRDFLALSGTMGRCGGKPVGDEKPDAPEDRYAAEYMGRSDETRGNPASAAPAPVPVPVPVVSPLRPEEADLSAAGQAEIALRSHEDDLNRARIESLSEKKGDAEALEELSAIEVVIETPPEVKAAADKAFVVPPEDADEGAVEVALEIRSKSESANVEVEDAVLAKVKGPKTGVDDNVGPLVRLADEKKKGSAAPPAPAGVVGAPTTKVGGSLGGVGTNAVTFVARVGDEAKTLSFLPPEADGYPGARQAAITIAKAWATAGKPPSQVGSNIVGYVSKARDLKDKYDTINGSPYAIHAVLPISSYPCKFAEYVTTLTPDKYYDARDVDEEFKKSRRDTVGEITKEEANAPLTCFILPKFKEKVEYLPINVAIPAVLDVLLGLCIERDFVITDLHDSNMALYNGKGVTFDYDRLVTKNTEGDPLANFIARIKEEEGGGMSLMQNQHVVDTFRERRLGKMTFAMYFKIYDMLSVLSLLEVTCGLLPDAQKAAAARAVASCVEALKVNGDTKDNRESAVEALKAVLMPLAWPTTILSSPLEAELKRISVERRVAMVANMRRDEAFWGVWQASGPAASGPLRREKVRENKREAVEMAVARAKVKWEEAEAGIRALRRVPTVDEKKALEVAKAKYYTAVRGGPRTGPGGLNLPSGGHRTPRRKGLPQLL